MGSEPNNGADRASISHDLFSGPMSTVLIFAARYTHPRNTGGTWAVVRALEKCWHLLDWHTRDQILREAKEAEYNKEDWEHLRCFADKFSENEIGMARRPSNGGQPDNSNTK